MRGSACWSLAVAGPLYALTRRLKLVTLRQSHGTINRLVNHVTFWNSRGQSARQLPPGFAFGLGSDSFLQSGVAFVSILVGVMLVCYLLNESTVCQGRACRSPGEFLGQRLLEPLTDARRIPESAYLNTLLGAYGPFCRRGYGDMHTANSGLRPEEYTHSKLQSSSGKRLAATSQNFPLKRTPSFACLARAAEADPRMGR